MPASPTPAQSAASRTNGARSLGPAIPEGKARAALNGTRHGLRGSTFTLLPDEDPAAWAAVLAGYLARLRPADAAELACVERLAACDWREARLERLEAETLFAGPRDTSEPDPRLGWSRTLPRYAAAIRRDREEALERLETLRAARPRLPADPTPADAARFRWLADRIERRLAATPATAASDTPEPEPAQAPAATLPTDAVTAEPDPPTRVAAAPTLNREQRRRLAALARQGRAVAGVPAATPPASVTGATACRAPA
jgi:hypothetical protein